MSQTAIRFTRGSQLIRLGAACLLMLSLISACVPTTGETAAEPQLVMPFGTGTEWSATVAGIDVQFAYVEELSVGGEPAPNNAGISTYFAPDECSITLAPRWITADRLVMAGATAAEKYEAQAASLSRAVAACIHSSLGDDVPTDYWVYAEAWSELYLETCGPIMAPLGLPVDDGSCDVPDYLAVLPG